MALLRVAPRSPRTFAFYEMAPGIMWAVLLYTPTNNLHLSKLAVGQDKDEWNHLERMSEAVSTYIGDLRETRHTNFTVNFTDPWTPFLSSTPALPPCSRPRPSARLVHPHRQQTSRRCAV